MLVVNFAYNYKPFIPAFSIRFKSYLSFILIKNFSKPLKPQEWNARRQPQVPDVVPVLLATTATDNGVNTSVTPTDHVGADPVAPGPMLRTTCVKNVRKDSTGTVNDNSAYTCVSPVDRVGTGSVSPSLLIRTTCVKNAPKDSVGTVRANSVNISVTLTDRVERDRALLGPTVPTMIVRNAAKDLNGTVSTNSSLLTLRNNAVLSSAARAINVKDASKDLFTSEDNTNVVFGKH